MLRIKLSFAILFTFLLIGSSAAVVQAASTTSGSSWTTVTSSSSNDLMAVAYGNGLFVAVGNNGTILTSVDGNQWTQQNLPYSPPSLNTVMLNSVTFGNGMFIAVGDKTILTSNDGKTWNPINYVTYEGNSAYYIQSWLTSVTYSNNTFIVLGKSGTIITSPDGVNWTQQIVNSGNQLNGITSGNNTFVAVGNSGTLLQQEAPVPISSVIASNGNLTVVLSSVPSATPTLGQFNVEQSINGGTPVAIQPSNISVNGTTINLTLPLISPTTVSQTVIDSASFNGGSWVASLLFTVSGSATGSLLQSIPAGTIIFGNGQALDINYANNPLNTTEVMNDVINSNSKIYTITFAGTIINNTDGSTLSPNQIALLPAVTYKDSQGDIWQFSAGDGPQIGTNQTNSVTATVTQSSYGSTVTVSISPTSVLTGATKYQVFQNDGLTSISLVTSISQSATVYPPVQIGARVVIKFYQADGITSVGTPQTVTLIA